MPLSNIYEGTNGIQTHTQTDWLFDENWNCSWYLLLVCYIWHVVVVVGSVLIKRIQLCKWDYEKKNKQQLHCNNVDRSI